jgi:hypothetical protein
VTTGVTEARAISAENFPRFPQENFPRFMQENFPRFPQENFPRFMQPSQIARYHYNATSSLVRFKKRIFNKNAGIAVVKSEVVGFGTDLS